jgi:hypothetical protein
MGKGETHGMSRHPAYAVWRSMKNRCELDTHHAWHNYGGRGITVCGRWHLFKNFWADMGETYKPGLSLERTDNNLGYCPQNCQWVTPRQQARNTRSNRMIKTPQGEMLLIEASELSGIGMTTLLYRHAVGWEPERMFDKPLPTSRSVDRETGL